MRLSFFLLLLLSSARAARPTAFCEAFDSPIVAKEVTFVSILPAYSDFNTARRQAVHLSDHLSCLARNHTRMHHYVIDHSSNGHDYCKTVEKVYLSPPTTELTVILIPVGYCALWIGDEQTRIVQYKVVTELHPIQYRERYCRENPVTKLDLPRFFQIDYNCQFMDKLHFIVSNLTGSPIRQHDYALLEMDLTPAQKLRAPSSIDIAFALVVVLFGGVSSCFLCCLGMLQCGFIMDDFENRDADLFADEAQPMRQAGRGGEEEERVDNAEPFDLPPPVSKEPSFDAASIHSDATQSTAST